MVAWYENVCGAWADEINGSKQAKLNEDKIREIRDDLKKNITQKEIAKKYNIDNSQISRINTGKTWNHVL